jgi:glycosyltransferase involved in cell wall biosynthesis
MAPPSSLLIFNYVMDPADPLLSHQYEAAMKLSEGFEKVVIVTGRVGAIESIPKIEVRCTDWRPGEPFQNVARLLISAVPLIVQGRYTSVFFHMTDVQAALLSPIIWLRRKRQYLWYAHTHKSPYLTFASLWLSGIVTSTSGSCPIKGKQVVTIGQAIDTKKFLRKKSNVFDLNQLIHIGRFDKSKNIDILISEFKALKAMYPSLTLNLVGSNANVESRAWAKKIVSDNQKEVDLKSLVFSKAIRRDHIPKVLSEHGCFIHAYVGSLDKTLIEATIVGIPVVTINPEYVQIFGKWSKGADLSLQSEYLGLTSLSLQELQVEIERRYIIAEKNHSLSNWILSLDSILKQRLYS